MMLVITRHHCHSFTNATPRGAGPKQLDLAKPACCSLCSVTAQLRKVQIYRRPCGLAAVLDPIDETEARTRRAPPAAAQALIMKPVQVDA